MGISGLRQWIPIAVVTLLPAAAEAAPPASCVNKFVGVWAFSGGTTRVNADGTANPKCALCVAVQHWTCSGNTYIITSPTSYRATLSADGRQMVGSAGIATRVGGAAVVAKPKTPPAQRQPPPQQGTAGSSSCSGQTGQTGQTGQAGAAPPPSKNCQDAQAALHVARATRDKYPAVSADEYRKAAAAARRAGDAQFELTILREAEPPPAPADNERCAALAREASVFTNAAETIEKTSPACADLATAAEHYFSAGKVYFRAIDLGQQAEPFLRSCQNARMNELFLRRDRLNYRIDEMKRTGRCGGQARVAPSSETGGPAQDDSQRRRECALVREKLMPHAPSEAWLSDLLARSRCKPDGTPM